MALQPEEIRMDHHYFLLRTEPWTPADPQAWCPCEGSPASVLLFLLGSAAPCWWRRTQTRSFPPAGHPTAPVTRVSTRVSHCQVPPLPCPAQHREVAYLAQGGAQMRFLWLSQGCNALAWPLVFIQQGECRVNCSAFLGRNLCEVLLAPSSLHF